MREPIRLLDNMIRLSTRFWPYCPVTLKQMVSSSKRARLALTYGAGPMRVYGMEPDYQNSYEAARNQYNQQEREYP